MLFGLLLAGHLVGDFIFQTDRQAALKRWPLTKDGNSLAITTVPMGLARTTFYSERHAWWLSIGANQGHCLTYHLTMAAFVLPVWHTWGTLAAFAVSWATHSIIDRRWPVVLLLRATGSRPWSEIPAGVMCSDQALHIAVLSIIAAVAGR